MKIACIVTGRRANLKLSGVTTFIHHFIELNSRPGFEVELVERPVPVAHGQSIVLHASGKAESEEDTCELCIERLYARTRKGEKGRG